MRFDPARGVRVTIAQPVLDAVFDECDRYDDVETGGRMIGTYRRGLGLDISVDGMIDAGPRAERARTSFFQDGDYQEGVFRAVERNQPAVEHLGTWHTHHVNGYPELSSGDLATYHRTVNHQQHNLDFWYALLITRRVERPERYAMKHYLFLRDDPRAYEIASKRLRIVPRKALWVPSDSPPPAQLSGESRSAGARGEGSMEQRARDDQVLRALFPDLRPFLSARTGVLSWKGQIDLIDFTKGGVVVTEIKHDSDAYYEAAVAAVDHNRFPHCAPTRDATPWLALRCLEARLNRVTAKLDEQLIERTQ